MFRVDYVLKTSSPAWEANEPINYAINVSIEDAALMVDHIFNDNGGTGVYDACEIRQVIVSRM